VIGETQQGVIEWILTVDKPKEKNDCAAFFDLPSGHKVKLSEADLAIVCKHRWRALKRKHTVYAISTINGRSVYMHRLLMGHPSGAFVDHVDGDGLNNLRENLRIATPSQNNCNRRMRSNNTSGFKGVSWDKKRGKWYAQICVNGKNKNCGYHNTPEAAHEAYIAAAADLHGDFGRVS
jgi:hypothetical protein